jgi:amino acid transporter
MPDSKNFHGTIPTRSGLGTFAGVFTPSILTILGIILFLRLGFVVGSAGLGRALLIIGLSGAIAILTAISLSAVATNIRVKGGGDYYLISRTLGVEFGGAIGIVLFLADAVSIAFYSVGFAEALHAIMPGAGKLSVPIIAGLAVAFLFIFAWLGADWATRLQFLIMSVVAAALLSFFYGGFSQWNSALLTRNWNGSGPDLGFWVLFAIFFPAITGFTQGVNMSGDLKDPGKSLPMGTFAAVGLSLLVYFGAAILFAGSLPGSILVGDYHSMKRVATLDWLVDAGLIAGTLSSAMASFLGAPRILQSLASDRIFPLLIPFARGVGPNANPRRAVLLSGAIAVVTISLGNLNFIASVVSMFFLITYALLNYATFYEARAASPSFRPRFRFFHARLSLLGAIGALGAMIAIDPPASGVAVAVLFAIHQYLKRTAGPARWADSRRSYYFQLVRENLIAIGDETEHPRDWRPCILAFCDDSSRCERLLRFASWIEGGSGLTTAVKLIEGDDEKTFQLRAKTEDELRRYIADRELAVFSRVVVAPDFRVGVETLIQSFGVGNIRANMVLLNRVDQIQAPGENEAQIRYGRELQEAIRMRCNVVVFDAEDEEWSRMEHLPASELRIDIWWWGERTSHLMLLLAYLMTRSERWSEAKIKVLVPSSAEAAEKSLERVRHVLQEVRINAQPEVVFDVNEDLVVKQSESAGLVFFPLRYRELHLLTPLGDQVGLETVVHRLPIVALSLAAEDIDLSAGPDEGKLAEVTAALDAAKDAETQAKEAEQEASRLAQQVEQKLNERETERSSADAANEEFETALREARLQARAAANRAAEARAQAIAAAEAAKNLGIEPPQKK